MSNRHTMYPPVIPVGYRRRFSWWRTIRGAVLGLLVMAGLGLGIAHLFARLDAFNSAYNGAYQAAREAAFMQGMTAGQQTCGSRL